MNIDPNVARVTRSLAGIAFQMPAPYAAGHPLTEGEASQMNQVFAENVGNNLRKKVEAGVAVEGADAREFSPEELQALVDEYVATYEPGVRSRGEGRVAIDPVEREALKLAKEKAIAMLREAGHNPKDYDIEPIRDAIFEQNSEILLKEAKRLIKAREDAKGKGDMAGIDLASLLRGKAQPEVAAAEEVVAS